MKCSITKQKLNHLLGFSRLFLRILIVFALTAASFVNAQVIRNPPVVKKPERQQLPPFVEPTDKQISELVAQIRKRPQPIRINRVSQNFKRNVSLSPGIPDVDLRTEIDNFGILIRDQGARNTSSVFAVTFLHEYLWSKYSQTHGGNPNNLDFSEEYLNFVSNYVTNEWVDGGFFDELNTGYQKGGIVLESIIPYRPTFIPFLSAWAGQILPASSRLKDGRLFPTFIKKWNSTTGLAPQQLDAIISSLKKGRPVAAGLRWTKPEKFAIEEIYGVPLMKMVGAGDVYDGQSVVFVGYKQSKDFPGGGYLIFRNSWGTGFGEQGYGYMPFEYASAYTNELLEYPMICTMVCEGL